MNRLRSEEIIRLRTKAFVILSMVKEDIPEAISELQDRQEQELLVELMEYEIDLKGSVLVLYATSYMLERNIDKLLITAEEAREIETEMEYVRNKLKPFESFIERCTALPEKEEAVI